MNGKDLLAVLGVAAVTMAATLVTLGPRRVDATDDRTAIELTIPQPELTVDGCVFAVKADKSTYQPDDTPVLEVQAVNPTEQPVETRFWVSISSSAPVSPLARMMPIPKVLWSDQCQVRLNPGEKKVVLLNTDVKLPAGQVISITLGDRQQAVLTDVLSLPVNPPLPTAGQGIATPTAAQP